MSPKTAVILAIMILALAAVLCNAYDNNRVAIIHQTVVIDRLPASFEGFTILNCLMPRQ